MRKSGLQKQIASIFNDVPVPEQGPKSPNLLLKMQGADATIPESVQDTESTESEVPERAPAPQPPAKSTATVQARAVHTPAVSTIRPKPLPRLQTTAPRQKPTEMVTKQVKKVLYGSAGTTMDPRQKKTTILVGVLSVVFAGVLILTLGGAGEKKSKTQEKASDTKSAVTGQARPLKQWQAPEPLPAAIRDPMNPQESRPEPKETFRLPGQLAVRGIVFSRNNPSAIVNDQIVRQGQVIDGVTVVAIQKDSVEFQQGEKRWTQPVQR